MAALCILEVGPFNKIYCFFMGIYLLLAKQAIGCYFHFISKRYEGTAFAGWCKSYIEHGYTIAAWILFFTLLYLLRQNESQAPGDSTQLS
jgi:hypothetical protein